MHCSFKSARLLLVCGFAVSLCQFAHGQDFTTDPDIPQQPTPIVPQQPNTNNTGSLNQGDDVDLSNLADFGGEVIDNRNQGFVGSTATKVDAFGFVGAASEISGPALADEATFGGGINSGFTPVVGTGGGVRGGGGFGGGAGGFGGFGSSTGFTVSRRPTPIRARLRPQFSFPAVTPTQTLNRFNRNFYSQPATANFNGSVRITINNKTATLQGNVATQQDASRMVRQLRLQPGVYRIDNQLNIMQ